MTAAGPYFVGVDGGGTKTVFVVVDASGMEVARHVAPTSNPAVIGFDQAATVLNNGFREVASQCGASLPFAGAWIGLSGFDRAGDRERLVPGIQHSVHHPTLTNDAELVLSKLPDATGLAIISGTGSIVIGKGADGTRARAGGWGHIFGDEGSGWALGVEALRAVAAWSDGRGPETKIVERVMAAWDLTDPSAIITRAYDKATTKKDIAQLSSQTIAASWDRDAVAEEIVARQAGLLADQVIAVASRLGFQQSIPLAMSGGLLLHVFSYRQAVLEAIQKNHPVGIVELVIDPALSAALTFVSSSKAS